MDYVYNFAKKNVNKKIILLLIFFLKVYCLDCQDIK